LKRYSVYICLVLLTILIQEAGCFFDLQRPTNTELDASINKLRSADETERYAGLNEVWGYGKYGKAAFPEARNLLKDENPYIRSKAIITLDSMGKTGDVIPELIGLLGDYNKEYNGPRFYSAIVLGELGAKAYEAVPTLIKLLDDTGTTRWAAAEALGKIGKAAKPAIPKLRQLLQDEDEFAKGKAREAINKLESL